LTAIALIVQQPSERRNPHSLNRLNNTSRVWQTMGHGVNRNFFVNVELRWSRETLQCAHSTLVLFFEPTPI